MANLPRGKLKFLLGLRPKMPDPVPELALEPSVNQIQSILRENWVFVSPIIPVYHDIEDFGVMKNWNGVV